MRQNEPQALDVKDASSLRRKGLTYLLLTLFFILVSSLSIWFVSSMFGGGELAVSLGFVTPVIAVCLGAFLLVFFLFDAMRFYFILRTLGIDVHFLYILKLSFINVFVSAITPFATGGGFAQLYYLVRKNVPLGSAMAGSTIRTLLTMAVLLVAAPILILVNPELLNLVGGGYAAIFVVTACIFAFLISLMIWAVVSIKRAQALVYRLTRFFRRKRLMKPRRARRIALGAFRELRNFRKGAVLFLKGNKKYLFLSIFCTAVFMILLFSLPLLLTRAMGYVFSPVFIYQSMTIVTFITYFAVTPGASGFAEAGFAFMFSGVGTVSEEHITSLTLLWRSLTVYAGALIGLVLFYVDAFTGKKGRAPRSGA
jgi:hypothetical protein